MTKRPTIDDLKNMGLVEGRDGTFSKGAVTLPISVAKGLPYIKWADESTQLNKESKPLAIFQIDPIGAPRMSRSDQWKTDPFHKDEKKRQRKPVAQYFRFKEALAKQAKEQGFVIPDSGMHLIFILPIPHSWSEKKKAQMDGAPHQQKFDWDNLAKGFCDCLAKSDAYIWDVRVTKYWGKAGKIIVYGNHV